MDSFRVSTPGDLLSRRVWLPDCAALGRALLLGHLILSPIVFSIDTAECAEHPKAALLALTAILLVALAVAAWIGSAGPTGGERLAELKRDPLTVGGVLFFLSAIVSTLGSISPALSFRGAPESHFGLVTISGYVVLFLATRRWCADLDDCRRLLSAAVIGVAVSSAYAAVQFAKVDPVVWSEVAQLDACYRRPFGTLGHANFLAGYLVMALPLVAYFAGQAFSLRRWATCVALMLIGTLGVVMVFASCSRAGWLALVCIGVAGVLAGWRLRMGRRMFAVAAIALPLFVVAGAVAWRGSEWGGLGLSVWRRLNTITVASSRTQIWITAWNLFRDQPLFGWGVDTFHLAFGQERTAAFGVTEWNTTPIRAHNPVLQLLATQGLLGLSAALVLVGGLGVAVRRAWRAGSPEGRGLIAAVVIAFVGFAVQVSLGFTVTAQGTLLVTLAAVVSRLAAPGLEPRAERRPWACHTAFLVAAVLVAAIFLRNRDEATSLSGRTLVVLLMLLASLAVAAAAAWRCIPIRRDEGEARAYPPPSGVRARLAQGFVWLAALGVASQVVLGPLRASLIRHTADRWVANDLTRALAEYERAIEHAPGDAAYWAHLGMAIRDNLHRAATREERREFALRGRAAFARAAELVPANAYYHVGLGRMQMELARLRLARPDQALAAYDEALRLDSNNAIYYADAANAALVMEQLDRADAYAARGEARYPYFGILHAHRGYVAYVRGNLPDAIRLVSESLTQKWYGEGHARRFAEGMLEKAKRQLEHASQRTTN